MSADRKKKILICVSVAFVVVAVLLLIKRNQYKNIDHILKSKRCNLQRFVCANFKYYIFTHVALLG